MMEKNAKIYVAGHRGMVGSAIVRELERQGYTNIITRTHKELDLTRQDAVEAFFAQEKPEYVFLAAAKVGGKVIGVDVDQAGVIAGYAKVDGLTVTSAMKGLYPATYDALNDVINNGNWANYVGQIATLGLISADDPEANYVQIPMGEGTQWSDSFTQDDYKAMVADMYSGKITVSNDISKAASDFATVITVDDQGAIKG